MRSGVVIEGERGQPDEIRGRLQRERCRLKKTVRELLMKLAEQASLAA
jgi:hypothetical protein